MFKNVLRATFLLLASSSAQGTEMKLIEYPLLKNLTIEVPKTWGTYNNERFGIQSPEKELEVAGTVYRANDKTIKTFTADKHSSISNSMPWYTEETQLSPLNDSKYTGFIQEYKGIWAGENEPTTYVVTTFQIQEYYLTLTFTSLTSQVSKYRKDIDKIIKSKA